MQQIKRVSIIVTDSFVFISASFLKNFSFVSLSKHTHTKKEGLILRLILLFSKTAATYSPTFTQYHRRGWA